MLAMIEKYLFIVEVMARKPSKEGLTDLQKQLVEMNLKEHENKKEMHDLQMKFFEEGRSFFKEARERYEKKE
uniref:Uncharacterized protein n=1 Tax=Acrobeloides nanus TaxID=290746 RepID=A0A914EDJ3_9BILA